MQGFLCKAHEHKKGPYMHTLHMSQGQSLKEREKKERKTLLMVRQIADRCFDSESGNEDKGRAEPEQVEKDNARLCKSCVD